MSKWTEFRDEVLGKARERADNSWTDLEKALRDTGDPTVIKLLDRHIGYDDVLQELVRRAESSGRGQAVRGAIERAKKSLDGYLLGGAGVTGALTMSADLLSLQSIPMLLLVLAGAAAIMRGRQDQDPPK